MCCTQDIILLHAGTNDIGQGADAQTVLDRLHMLLTGIVERTPQVRANCPPPV